MASSASFWLRLCLVLLKNVRITGFEYIKIGVDKKNKFRKIHAACVSSLTIGKII